MRCDQCKHWPDKADEWEGEQAGLRECQAVRPRWDIADEASAALAGTAYDSDENEKRFTEVRIAALRDAKAYVQDGSQYTASLWTMPDFFCALFTPE